MPVSRTRGVTGLLLALVATIIASVAPAGAQDAPALTTTTGAVYRVDVDAEAIRVEFTYAFRNETTTTAFPGFFESLPADARDVAATTGSTTLAAAVTEESDGFSTWLVAFARPLDPGDTTEVVLSWTIDGGSSLPGPVVQPGAVAFDVYGPGGADATWTPPVVELPERFVAVVDVAPTEPYEIVPYRALDLRSYTTTLVDLPPAGGVTDWSAGGAWTDAVVDRVEAIVGSLDAWFGPRAEIFEIRRSFPGDDHPEVDEARVGLVESDAASVDHQLAHLWLVDVPVDGEWFVEGLAAAFAGDTPDADGPAGLVPGVVNEIGAAGVRAVVDALRAESITYPGVVGELQPLPPDWRTVLDHLEGVGGAEDLTARFAVFFADEEAVADLDQRAAARVDYSALEFRAGGWTLPPYLRMAMAAWDFDAFAAGQGAVSDAIGRRDALLTWAESLELVPRDDAKDAFESAVADMSAVDELLDEEEAALAAFDEAEHLVNGDRGLLARVGLLGHDPDGDLAALREAWAEGDFARVERDGHELASLVEGAVGDGTIRLLVPALGLLALWWLVRWVRARTARSADDDQVENSVA